MQWAPLLITLVALIVLRAPFISVPLLNVDEALFAVAGRLMNEGSWPYADFYDTKPPGLLAVYALGQLIEPWGLTPVRLALAASHGGAALALALLATWAGRPRVGALASFAYVTAVSVGPALDFQAGESEGFMLPLTTLAVLCAARAVTDPERGRRWALGWGFAAAGAVCFKQPAILDLAGTMVGVGGLALLSVVPRRRALEASGWALAGFVGVLAGVALVFALAGALDDLIFNCWTYPTRVYGAVEVPGSGGAIVELITAHPLVFALGIPAAALAVWIARRAEPNERVVTILLLFWGLGAMMGAAYSGRPYPHYFLQAAPPLALSVAWSIGRVLRFESGCLQRQLAGWGLVVVSALSGVWLHVVPGYQGAPGGFGISETVAKLVSAEPGTSLFVWGFAPGNYVLSRRLPSASDPTGDYTSGWDPIAQRDGATQRQVPHIRERVIGELLATPPDHFVDFSDAGYVDIRGFPRAAQLLDARYELVTRLSVSWWGNPRGKVAIYRLRSDQRGSPN